jgi:hypothetical protein
VGVGSTATHKGKDIDMDVHLQAGTDGAHLTRFGPRW